MFNIAENEKDILDFWNENDIFKKSVKKESPEGDYSFYDGPPFATGLPHYGHIVASAIKDMIPRYMTMKGYKVERRWGWDCHGLPVENLIEKELGFKTKKDIEDFGEFECIPGDIPFHVQYIAYAIKKLEELYPEINDDTRLRLAERALIHYVMPNSW